MVEIALEAADKASDVTLPPLLTPPRRLQPYSMEDLAQLPKREPLIKGLLDRGCMSVMYGDSNSGKTFTALDLCLHVALGWTWCKRRVRKSRVLYIAAEGGFGLVERLRAFQLHHNITEVPFHVIPSAVDFRSSVADIEGVIKEAKALGGVDLIVIDTLARAISGGDENSSVDMGMFVKNSDHLRQGTGAHVMVIHHTGKDAARGARGHSSLRAATDTEIAVRKSDDKAITMEVTKQRDGRTGGKFSFKLEVVPLGSDEDGDPITSCVLLPEHSAIQSIGPNINQSQARALSALNTLLAEQGEEGVPKHGMKQVRFVQRKNFTEALEKANISSSDNPDNVKRQIDRIIKSLIKEGFIDSYDDKIWLTGQAGQ